MLPRGYRFVFFDDAHPEPAAVLQIRYRDDATACAEAGTFLRVSSHNRVEVWRGTQKLHVLAKGADRPLPRCRP